jgi:GTPase
MGKSGFVTIIGRPNVGKSTLINRLVHTKMAIVSDKAQTTRDVIQGILHHPSGQVVFVDTPGIHKPRHELGNRINQRALHAIDHVDVIVFVMPYNEKIAEGDRFILDQLKDTSTPVICVINKLDLAPNKNDVLRVIEQAQRAFHFAEFVPISALENDNIDRLTDVIISYLPEGEPFYPEDVVMTKAESWWVAEVVREKVLRLTNDEIPHSVAVVVTKMEENEDGYLDIDADIIVEKKTQKGIIIGNQGSMIKTIGTQARKDLNQRFKRNIYLNLYVKHESDWRNKPHRLLEFGYGNDE